MKLNKFLNGGILSLKNRMIPIIVICFCIAIISVVVVVKFRDADIVDFNEKQEELTTKTPEFLFGFCIDSLNVVNAEINRGETLGTLLAKYSITPQQVNEIVQKSKGVFDLRQFREGNSYYVLSEMGSLQKPLYFIYEHSVSEYVVFNLKNEITVKKYEKDVVTERRYGEATITSSLWAAAQDAGMNGALAMNLSDVFQWSIDFYAIQKGDKFNVIYDELFIDGKSIGVGTVWGACFTHNGKDYYAIRHEYNDGNIKERGYWDETGKSLRSAFLKAPLKFSRISSKFTNSRMHPVLRIARPHHGVDYAAPSGTPVQSISNGVVIAKGYSGGGGNTVKIKHARGYVSGYLHLKGYAKGLRVGSSVKQGDLIGYVGSTGLSTGPHLDFRIWLNGKPINPLSLSNEKGEDIGKKYKVGFDEVKNKVISELNNKRATNLITSDTTQVNFITVPQK